MSVQTRFSQIGKPALADFQSVARERGRRLERGYDQTHKAVYRLVLPTPGQVTPELAIDISFLLELPFLAEPFAEALLDHYGMRSFAPRTITVAIDALRQGFVSYMREAALQESSLGDLDTRWANGFIKWLNAEKNLKARYSEGTRSKLLGIVKTIFVSLRQSKKWSGAVSSTLYIRKNPWPGYGRRGTPTRVLQAPELIEIYRSCVKEIFASISRFQECAILIEEARERLFDQPDLATDFADLGITLCALKKRVNTRILMLDEIRVEDKALFYAITKFHGGIGNLSKAFYPSPRDLVPFAVLLSIHTLYNPETLLTSLCDDFQITESLGQPVLVASAFKRRAGKPQYSFIPVADEIDNPARLLDFLRVWTSPLRPFASPYYANRTFIFLPETASRAIKGFGGARQSASNDITWSRGLMSFIAKHNLSQFTLNQIRPTALDIVHSIENGDIRKMMAVANHQRPDTTNSHYLSDGARQRNAERLSEVMAVRRRWLDSNGKVDSRGIPSGGDISSATPGWQCLDPYSSPVDVNGRLCSAFGHCPACPLSSIDFASPYACAQAHNLLDAVRRSAQTMAPQAWLKRMGPVHEALIHRWLPQFSNKTVEEAQRLNIAAFPTPE